MVKTIYLHKEQYKNDLLYSIETTYSVYVNVSVKKNITNIIRNQKCYTLHDSLCVNVVWRIIQKRFILIKKNVITVFNIL